MKKLILGFVPVIMLFIGCAGNAKPAPVSDSLTLDQAIAEAAVRIEERIPAGSKIAPLNFNSPSDRFSSYVLDELTVNLVENRKLIVVDRTEIELIRSEIDFQYSGEVDDDSIQEAGRKLGAQSIISGSLTDMGGFYRIMIRVLNVQNASVEVQYRANIVNDHVVTALLSGGRTAGTASTSSGAGTPAASGSRQTGQTTQSTGQTQTVQVPAQPSAPSASQPAIVIVQGTTLADKLQWLEANAANNSQYSIVLEKNESIDSHILSYSGRRNVTLRLSGAGGERKISNTGRGTLFTIEAQVTLILDNGITLQGRNDNDVALVKVNNRGTLVMKNGAKISNNSNNSKGGGVAVNDNGTFRMEGGEIFNNKSHLGGGVYVAGSFIMNGGVIFSNSATSGGGVSVEGGLLINPTMTMGGGEISGNSANFDGGGVYSINATFTMTGGEILGNSSSGTGGGLWTSGQMYSSGDFKKTGGTIYGNTGDSNENWARNGGYAVYNMNHFRNSTSGPNVRLDVKTSGSAGGWEN